MSLHTLTWVSDVGDTPDKYGNLYVNVSFDDGTAGYIAGRPEKATEHQSALTALLNTESEFQLEPKGKTQKGADKFKIKAYPGYEPAQQDGGGSARSSWYNSEEGVRFTAERTDRRCALMQAVTKMSGEDSEVLLWQAEIFYEWLRQTSDAVVPPKGAVDTPTVSPTASDPSSVEGNSKSGDPLGSPSTSTTTAEDRGQVVADGEADITCPPHSPNEHADKRAGRFPCLTCGLYVRGTMG